MSNDSSNPFQSPNEDAYLATPEGAAVPLEPRDSIDYMGSYTKFFDHPDWVNGMLLSSVALLIPVVGGLVVLGYEYDCVARSLTGRGERPYSAFTFDRFGEYLMRAVWVFLYGLCTTLVILPVVLVCFGVFVLFGSFQNEVLMVVGMCLAALIYMVSIVLLNLLIMPGMLRVALTNDVMQGFDFGFMKDFMKKMWVEQILVFLFIAVTSGIVINLGYLLCCVGVFPAMVLTWFSMTQLMMQLYQVYLYRGGRPIDIVV